MSNWGDQISDTFNDTAITTKIKGKLFAAPEVSSLDVSVETDHGKVILSGNVPDRDTAERAESIARDTDGVKEVINNLFIE